MRRASRIILKISIIAMLTTGFALTAPAADDDRASANWKKYCAVCHGGDGKADTVIGRKMRAADLTSPAVFTKYKKSPEKFLKLISDGLTRKDKAVMKPLKGKLNEDEIRALGKYIENLAEGEKENVPFTSQTSL